METYAKRMRDRKVRGGKQAQKAEDGGFGVVHLSQTSGAILSLWLRRARDSLVVRARDRAYAIRSDLDVLLAQIKEVDDWYFGAGMRMDGHAIKADGVEVIELRRSLESEAALRIKAVDDELVTATHKLESEIEAERMALEQQMRQDRKKAMEEAEARVQELTRQKKDKQAVFAAEEKTAALSLRATLAKNHKAELKGLDQIIATERERRMQVIGTKMATRRADLRKKLQLKEKTLMNERQTADKAKMKINEGVMRAIKPKESKWQGRALVWNEKARRMIEQKTKEDAQQASVAAVRKRR
jgi:hypothetical protein